MGGDKRPPLIPSDAELVKEASKGNRRSFEQLVNRYVPVMYGFFRYLGVRKEEEIEDLVQETFLKVIKGFTQYNPEKPFITWIATIGRYTYIDTLRKKNTNVPLIEEMVSQQNGIDKIENKETIQNIFKRLPEESKFLLEMRFFYNLSFAEIGEITGETPGALRVRLYRILTKLRYLGRVETLDARKS